MLEASHRIPDNHDDPDEEEDVEANDDEDRNPKEPVTVAIVHPTLLILKSLNRKHNTNILLYCFAFN